MVRSSGHVPGQQVENARSDWLVSDTLITSKRHWSRPAERSRGSCWPCRTHIDLHCMGLGDIEFTRDGYCRTGDAYKNNRRTTVELTTRSRKPEILIAPPAVVPVVAPTVERDDGVRTGVAVVDDDDAAGCAKPPCHLPVSSHPKAVACCACSNVDCSPIKWVNYGTHVGPCGAAYEAGCRAAST